MRARRVLTMFAAVLGLGASACGFEPAGDPGDLPGDGGTDAGGALATLRDDTVADFTGPGTQLDAARIEAWGTITPAAYLVGGLLARLDNDRRFDDPVSATWAQVTGAGPDGTGFAGASLDGLPTGVGLGAADGWTYWLEGELWLDAGVTQLELRADDAAFVDLAAPGSGDFGRVVTAQYSADGRASYIALRAGWHPVRVALRQDAGDLRFELRLQGPGEVEPRAPRRDRLRVRVDELRGTVLAGWDGSLHHGTPRHTLDTGDLIDKDFADAGPTDLGLTDDDYWSVRWAGQFYVTHPGTYRLRLDTDDGQRLYVGGVRTVDGLGTGPADREAIVDLAAGWNDLVLDHSESTGRARARLRVLESPDPSLDHTLPAARLRPVAPRHERVETAVDPTDRAVPDGIPGAAESVLDVAAAPGAVLTSIDVGVAVDHPRVADLEARLIHPDGTAVLLRSHQSAGGNGQRTWRFSTDALAGKPAAGVYRAQLVDTVAGQAGRLVDFAIELHHRGGPPPIAPIATWTSAVRDLGDDVTAIERVRFGARVPGGAGAQLLLRTCADPAACLDEPWSIPMRIGAGEAPRVSPRRYLQYRVELTSEGDREAELDWVEIDYRRRAM